MCHATARAGGLTAPWRQTSILKGSPIVKTLPCCAALLAWLIVSETCVAEELSAVYTPVEFASATGDTLRYRWLEPLAVREGEKYPLVIFLHGAGERGDDNVAQLKHVAGELAHEDLRKRYPCFVMAPQCPKEQRWVEVDWSAPSHQMPAAPGRNLKLVLEAVEQLQQRHPVDPRRLYVVGLSMGGYGTWDLLQRRPDTFAAGIPICGGGDPSQAAQLTRAPIWVFHGADDPAVPVGRSRSMVAAIREAGGQPIYTEYEGVKHDSWTQTAQNRLVWDWLFAQRQSEVKTAGERQ